MRTFALPAAARSERVLATLICTDIVDSTATAERSDLGVGGDAGRAERQSRRQIDKFRGKGWPRHRRRDHRHVRRRRARDPLRGSDQPRASALGFGLRVGVHTGEVEVIPDNIRAWRSTS